MSFFSSLHSGHSIDTSIEIYSDSEGEREFVKESFVEKQLPREESPFVPLAHLFPLPSTQEAHQTPRRRQGEEVESEEMLVDNPFVPAVPPARGNWLMIEGPKNMLIIEAPPLDYLPRVVDRMDDVVEKEVGESDGSGPPVAGKVNGNTPIISEEDESDDDIVYRGMSSRVDVKPAAEILRSIPTSKRKRAAPVKPRKVGGSRIPAIPTYRYPAGKMTADEFIAAADTFHLVIEQEGSAGRIGRALMEFDLKPRKFSTGSVQSVRHTGPSRVTKRADRIGATLRPRQILWLGGSSDWGFTD